MSTLISCNGANEAKEKSLLIKIEENNPRTIRKILPPDGFRHSMSNDSFFADWLLDQELREEGTGYLYNGERKRNQSSQLAVLDIDIGKKNLIQCADAAIKLRADYLFQSGRVKEINFISTAGDLLSFSQWQDGYRWKEQSGKLVAVSGINSFPDTISSYKAFMELVYSYCGTYSLSQQLVRVNDAVNIQPGDIFVQGGFPGHAVTVMTVAKNHAGEILFLLSQGYMPAQDIHILKNQANQKLSPWYSVEEINPLMTPQWTFKSGSLMRWK